MRRNDRYARHYLPSLTVYRCSEQLVAAHITPRVRHTEEPWRSHGDIDPFDQAQVQTMDSLSGAGSSILSLATILIRDTAGLTSNPDTRTAAPARRDALPTGAYDRVERVSDGNDTGTLEDPPTALEGHRAISVSV